MTQNNENQTKKDYYKLLKDLGSYIKNERKKAGYKDAGTFAIAIGIGISQYREYERGETDMQLSSLVKILNGFNKSIEELFIIPPLSADYINKQTLFKVSSSIENQVRHQVEKANGIKIEQSLDSDDIGRLTKILIKCYEPSKKNQILKATGLAYKTIKFSTIFDLILANGWIEMKYPDRPKTPKQQYITTEAGKRILKSSK